MTRAHAPLEGDERVTGVNCCLGQFVAREGRKGFCLSLFVLNFFRLENGISKQALFVLLYKEGKYHFFFC